MKIAYTRAMLKAALEGKLDDVETFEDPYFGLQVPASVPGVPAEVLNPRNTWKDKSKYDDTAKKLVNMFHENFKEYEKEPSEAIKEAGPKKI